VLVALDAFFRARRRRVPVAPWVGWLVVAAVPLPVAWLWLRLLGATGAMRAPDGPVLPDRFPLETSGIVAMASAVLAAALATWVARFAARRLWAAAADPPEREGRRERVAPGVEGLAIATMLWLCAVAALAWVFNPYAAGLLVPAVHLWLLIASGRGGARVGGLALVVALVLPVLAVVHLALALDLGPLGMAWGSALGAASGAGGPATVLIAGLFAALAGAVRVLFARRRIVRAHGGGNGASIRTRGPLTYAGPGSLGGTESALRR
jgi:hypothetical protein